MILFAAWDFIWQFGAVSTSGRWGEVLVHFEPRGLPVWVSRAPPVSSAELQNHLCARAQLAKHFACRTFRSHNLSQVIKTSVCHVGECCGKEETKTAVFILLFYYYYF